MIADMTTALSARPPAHPGLFPWQWWNDAGWVQINGHWVALRLKDSGRLLLREQSEGQWVVLIDGTVLTAEHDRPLVWDNRYDAGLDGVKQLAKNWHGPSWRFRPREHWIPWDEGMWMRELFVPCRSGATGRRIALGIGPYGSPVATVRPWRRP